MAVNATDIHKHGLRLHPSTSIDLEVDARNELSFIAGEEQCRIGHVHRISQSAEGYVADELLPIFRRVWDADEGFEQTSAREQRTERVHSDLGRPKFGCEAFCCLFT